MRNRFWENCQISAGDRSLTVAAQLRRACFESVTELFEQRLETGCARWDAASQEVLVAEHQRWATTARGAELPAFLESPPPVFEALPPRRSIRVITISDFGCPGAAQRKVAAAAAEYHRLKPFDLGLTAGDNFVMRGVTGPADPRWQDEWERLYDPPGVRFFARLDRELARSKAQWKIV